MQRYKKIPIQHPQYVNDTIYFLENSSMQPAYIFGFGKYTYPIEDLEILNIQNPAPPNYFRIDRTRKYPYTTS